jgi:hypothetical protein
MCFQKFELESFFIASSHGFMLDRSAVRNILDPFSLICTVHYINYFIFASLSSTPKSSIFGISVKCPNYWSSCPSGAMLTVVQLVGRVHPVPLCTRKLMWLTEVSI